MKEETIEKDMTKDMTKETTIEVAKPADASGSANTDLYTSFSRLFRRVRDKNPGGKVFGYKTKIGIVGLSAYSGVSTLAFSMARYIANMKKQSPVLVEISDRNEGVSGWNYDLIGVDRRFAGRDFLSHYRHLYEGKRINDIFNLDEGVNLVLRLPTEAGISLDIQQFTSLINNAAGDVVICDFSSRLSFGVEDEDVRRESLARLLKEMSLIIFLVNPSPSKLLGGVGRLSMIKELEINGAKVIYGINMFGKGINRKELLSYLRPKEYITIPMISPVELFEAEYNCMNPFQCQGAKEGFTKIIETALGKLA